MSVDKIVSILKRIPFFEGLDKSTLYFFARYAELVQFKEGDFICRQGDRAECMYVIVKGKVKVFRTEKDGEEKILNYLTPEDAILGEMSLLDGLPRSASATAVEETIAFSLSRKDFHIFLQDNLSATLKIIEILSLRLRAADERLADKI